MNSSALDVALDILHVDLSEHVEIDQGHPWEHIT